MRLPLLILGAGLLLGGVLIGACQPPVAPSSPTMSPPITQVQPPASMEPSGSGLSAIRANWESGKHANTYVVDERGENNACARCHSPWNWVPTDSADLPSTCTSCKFTVPIPKPVTQAEWKSVECSICHRVENSVATPQVAWLNALVAQYDTSADPYEAVKTNREVCEKCHRDSYGIDLGSGAHAGYDCTRCHDAHSLKASCAAPDCHVPEPGTPIAGHDAAHGNVTCQACHDASGLAVGPGEDGKEWVTFRVTEPEGKTSTDAYPSHNLRRTVDCARCHYPNNPWNLTTAAQATTPGP